MYSLVLLLVGVAIGNASASKAGTPAADPSPAPSVSLPATITSNNPGDSTTGPASGATPAPAPTSHVLIRFAGNGIENSAPFNVGNSPLTVRYTFNCANFGQAGNFQADLLYGNQSSLNSDDQTIANNLAMSGAQTTTVYPQDPGQDYYLSVNSECSWRIKVVGQ